MKGVKSAPRALVLLCKCFQSSGLKFCYAHGALRRTVPVSEVALEPLATTHGRGAKVTEYI